MKYSLWFSAALVLSLGCAAPAEIPSKQSDLTHNRNANYVSTVFLTSTEISEIKQHPERFRTVVASAEKNLNYQTHAVADFAPDPHYASTGINSSENNGKIFADDARMAYTQALAYLATGESKYAATAQRIIDAWSTTLKTVSTEQGKADINFNAPYLIMAAAWTKDANQWSAAKFDQLLRNVILPASTRKNDNNHGLWAILMEASAAQYLSDKNLMESAYTRWNQILKGAIDDNGVMTREVERSGTSNWRGGADKGIKGIAYTHFALLPVALTAKIFSDEGYPVTSSETGKLIQKAYHKAAVWTDNPEYFPYYSGPKSNLEMVNNAAYFVLMEKLFPDPTGKQVIKKGNLQMNAFNVIELFGEKD